MTLSIQTFWEAATLAEKIYWLIAIPFSLVFIIQLIITFIGGDISHDHDISHDVTIDSDHGIGFQFLSIKNMVGFFTIFGWSGIAALSAEKSIAFTVIISMLSGFAMMFIMSLLLYYLGKLTEEGNLKLENAIGKIGTVYLTIPAARKGIGKVQINVQGFQTLDAMTDVPEDIKIRRSHPG